MKILDKKLAYEVDQIKTVKPKNVKYLEICPGKDYITLLTCTPYGVNSHRLLVRGHRIPYEEHDGVKSPIRKLMDSWQFRLVVALVIIIGATYFIRRGLKKS